MILTGELNGIQHLTGILNTKQPILLGNFQDKTVELSTSTNQTIKADAGYDGLSSVTVPRVTADIDANIQPSNILEGVEILGVEGTAPPILYSGTGRCYTYNMVIPDGVTEIPTSAYEGCTKMESIIIPNSVTTIGRYSLRVLYSLKEIIIPDSVVSIGDYALQYATSITDIVIPDSVTYLGEYAFYGCTRLTSVSLFGRNVIAINNGCFGECQELTSINLDNITSIGTGVFRKCVKLDNIVLSNQLISCGDNAFAYCSRLEHVTLQDGFDCNLDISASTRYSVDTIIAMFDALKNNTGLTAKTLKLGTTNLAKLTSEQLQIATNKNWNLA